MTLSISVLSSLGSASLVGTVHNDLNIHKPNVNNLFTLSERNTAMQLYSENPRAGIHQYESGDDYIIVRWHNASYDYKFTYESAGKIAVEVMKMMAESKRGLSVYITTQVKDKFAEKIPVKGTDKTNFMNIEF